MVNTVEVRCPVGPQKLFVKLKLGEEFGGYVDGNLFEFSCSDCAKRIGREKAIPVRVFHRYNFVGELVQTLVKAAPGWSGGCGIG